MANEKNLKPIKKGQLSKEEAKRRGKKGGIKSAQVRKEIKTCREILLMMSNYTPNEDTVESLRNIFPGLEEKYLTYKTVMTLKQLEKALRGDTEAFKVCRDTMGEKPTDKVEQRTELEVNKIGLSKQKLEAIAKSLLRSKIGDRK
jgi:hypothetical protein